MNKLIFVLWVCLYSTSVGCKGYISPPIQSPTPIASPAPSSSPSPMRGSIDIKCISGCSDDMAVHLPDLIKVLKDTEHSQCFMDYFKGQKKIDEAKGMTGEQIVKKLNTSVVSTTLDIYYPNIFHRVFAKECGFDSEDGSISMKAQCYNAYDDCGRASFFGHEVSHSLGFTHRTAGNQAAGNEQTVPYLINSAFDKCCALPTTKKK